MAGVTLSNSLRRRDPAPAWRWRLDLRAQNFNGQLSQLIAGAQSNLGNSLSTYAEEVQVPFIQVQPGNSHVNAMVRYYPHDAQLDPFTIMFYEDDKYSITTLLSKWMKIIYDSDGTSTFSGTLGLNEGSYGVPSDYMAHIDVYANDYNGKDSFRFQFRNVFPSHIQDYQYSHDSMRIITTCTFYAQGMKVL